MQNPKEQNQAETESTKNQNLQDSETHNPDQTTTTNEKAEGDTTSSSEPKDKYESYMSQVANVPAALPQGWVVRYSRSQPDYQYFFHQDTGQCQWEMPVAATQHVPRSQNQKLMIDTDSLLSAVIQQASNNEKMSSMNKDPKNTNLYRMDSKNTSSVSAPAPSGILKRKSNYSANPSSASTPGNSGTNNSSKPSSATVSISAPSAPRPSKRSRKDHHHHPKEVRVLHILKKHAKSRRPSSWRKKKITITKDEAIAELQELIAILKEVEETNDAKELRATFEELAKTESDCSSSKRGGDLGFFGKKKMQPAFEKASFALKIGQLSEIVETSSGVHVILRLG